MKRRRLTLVLGVFILLTTITICSAAEDVVLVMDILHGKAYYETGAKKGKEVVLVDFLAEGDTIKLAPQTVLILNYFVSGIKEELTGPGSITVGKSASQPEGAMVVKREKSEYIPPKSAISRAELQQSGAAALRGGKKDSQITLDSLDYTDVRSTQPVFQWRPVEGADTYRIKVSDAQQEILKLDVETAETNFTVDKSGLIRGEEYCWIVLALAKGKIVAKGEGQFVILTEERLKEVERAEKAIEMQYPQEAPGRLISLAIAYQHYGLLDDAAAILRKLHKAYPENEHIRNWAQALDPGFVAK